MKVAVCYFSRSGNTKKLAEAIAAALGVPAETVDHPLTERVDALFLGSAVYAAGVDESIKTFLRENRERIGTLYNFSTAALLPSTYKQVAKLAAENGITLSDREFHCRGAFAMLHRGHPDAQDLEAAAAFARSALR